MTKGMFNGNQFKEVMAKFGIDPKKAQQAAKHNDDFQKQQSQKFTRVLMKRRYTHMLATDSIFSDPDLKNASFANFDPANDEQTKNKEKAREIAKQYILNQRPFNTMLVGGVGKGKTHLALSILKGVNEYMREHDRYYGCLFMDVNEMMTRIMNYEFHGGQSKYSQHNMVMLCKQADLLVLDDLGTESSMRSNSEANNMTQKVLYEILNSRNNTIVTTNLSSIEMSNVYNAKLVSRVKRHLGNNVIKFTDETKDMRQSAW